LGTVRFRHEGEAGSLAFSPDGTILAGGTQDGSVILWEARSGKELRRVRGPAGQFAIGGLIAFSPDGKVLAAPAERTDFGLWEVATGKLLRKLTLPIAGRPTIFDESSFHTVRFSPDGKSLAVNGVGLHGYVFDAATGRLLRHFESATRVDFSPDGHVLVAIFPPRQAPTPRQIEVRRIDTGEVLQVYGGFSDFMCDLAFSPDGRTLATAGTDRITLWEAATGKVRGHLEAKMGQVKNLAFTPDGRTLVAGGEGSGKVFSWDVATGAERQQIDPRVGILRSMALSPDGKTVAIGGLYSTIRLFDLASGRELLSEYEGHDAEVNSMAYSADGKLLAVAGENRQVVIWDTATGQPARQFRGTTARQITFSPDGQRLALLSPGRHYSGKFIHLWDAVTGQELFRIPPGDVRATTTVAFAADGKTLVSSDWDNRGKVRCDLNVWEASTGRHLSRVTLAELRPDCLALSPDGATVAVAGGSDPVQGLIRICDLRKGKQTLDLLVQRQNITSIAFSPDGRLLVSGGTDQIVRLWEVATGQ
jgi:WD40 repeat protein